MLLVAALLAPAAPPALPPRDRGDLAVRAREVLRAHCAECHGDTPARGDVSVLDHPGLGAGKYPVPLLNPADPKRSLVLEYLRDGSMPPGGRARPTDGEIQTLADWIAAGAPGYPRTFDDRYAAAAARADWDARPPAERPHVRYLSFAHLVRDGAAPPDLKEAETNLRAALGGAAPKAVAPVPVDPTATVFRLDLRAAGWGAGDRYDIGTRYTGTDAHPLTAFDTLLLEYPYRPADDVTWAAGMGARTLPVVRADWLADALAPGAPLAAEVRALADLDPAKEPPCGPRPGRFFSGKGVSGRPLEALHAGDPDAQAFPLKAEVVVGDDFDTPTTTVKVGEKYRLRITTDRTVRVRVLRVLSSGDLMTQILESNVLTKKTTLLGPRTNDPFKAGTLLRGGNEEAEYIVVFASEKEVPEPTLLRSRHSDFGKCKDQDRFAVCRFLFPPPGAAFDPAAVVRRVVPLTVRRRE